MRKSSAYIDGFFGDGGKGNALSSILEEAALRVKFPAANEGKPIFSYSNVGANNAANSYFIHGGEFVLRQTPAGVLIAEKAFSQIGEEKYIRPEKLMEEMKMLLRRGIKVTPDNFGIAPNAHITLQYHIDADQENLHTVGEHMSTGNGVLQTAADKYARKGLRFIEFLDQDLMTEILLEKVFIEDHDRKEKARRLAERYQPEREFLSSFVMQDHVALRKHGSHYAFAVNAHGVGLDINAGLYPGITSSHPARAPRWADTIFGVFKLYVSSVGARDRAFVSRMDPDLEPVVREAWGERGTGSGKNRLLGWFDAVLARYSIAKSEMDYLIGTCGDRMTTLHTVGVKPKIVVAYEIDGKRYEEWQDSFHRRDFLRRAKPITVEFNSWENFTEADRQTLHPHAQKYVDRIQQELGREFVMLTQGPRGKQDTIIYQHPLDL
ncbi:MAG: adenylosuccinate synthetase [Nanoarchaeota archaeon]